MRSIIIATVVSLTFIVVAAIWLQRVISVGESFMTIFLVYAVVLICSRDKAK